MDKKVRYYRAVNWLYQHLEVLQHSPYFDKYLDEFYSSLDGIVEVLAYDFDLVLSDKMKVVHYISVVRMKAIKLPC